MKSVWIVSDRFAKNAYLSFRGMNNAEAKANNMLPYLFENYNVVPIHPDTWSQVLILTRVINALISGLNENDYLPRYIMIVLDKHLVANAGVFDFGVSHTI